MPTKGPLWEPTILHNTEQMKLIVWRYAEKQSANQDSLLSSLGK